MQLDLEQKIKAYQDNRKESSQGKIVSPRKGLLRLTQRRDWTQGGKYVAMNSGTRVWERDVIAEVEDTKSVKVQLTIHESDVTKLHKGMPVALQIPALDNKEFSGIITQVSSLGKDLQDLVPVGEMEERHGQAFFRFMVQVNEKDDRFLPGMSAIVKIPFSSGIENE
jgi:multidrug resistance efflux pump